MNADEIKAVKEAHAQGAIIQFRHKPEAIKWPGQRLWCDVFRNEPHWDFSLCDYRVAPLLHAETK